MTAYYNEIDPYAAQWLRNLIAAGHIAPGDVDERSIRHVHADDVRGYEQCHFFAGIAGWPYALRLAGWPDDRPVWTGSCPCQPFSAAGKQQGTADERHLWPEWFRLIKECQPDVIFGEQVEAAIRHGWLDLVQSDLEGLGYAFAPVGIPAAGFGAPHIRARLWFVAEPADTDGGNASAKRLQRGGEHGLLAQVCGSGRLGNNNNPGLEGLGSGHQAESGRDGAVRSATSSGESGGVGVANGTGSQPGREGSEAAGHRGSTDTAGSDGRVADTANAGHERRRSSEAGDGCDTARLKSERLCDADRPGPTNGHWRDADWLHCRDGKWRPVEPGTFPLAHGAAARVGRLRAYGNAIVPQVAAEMIKAFVECRPC